MSYLTKLLDLAWLGWLVCLLAYLKCHGSINVGQRSVPGHRVREIWRQMSGMVAMMGQVRWWRVVVVRQVGNDPAAAAEVSPASDRRAGKKRLQKRKVEIVYLCRYLVASDAFRCRLLMC